MRKLSSIMVINEDKITCPSACSLVEIARSLCKVYTLLESQYPILHGCAIQSTRRKTVAFL